MRFFLPSTGSSWVEFPRFIGTTKTLSHPAIPFAALRFLRLAIPVVYLVLRSRPALRHLPDGPGVLGRLSPCRYIPRETTGLPTFLRNPPVHLPCSPTPVGSTPPGLHGDADAALATSTAKAPARKLSRLNHTAFALAVYASPRLLPLPTQDSLRLPARLYRTGFEPAGSAERFLNVSYISSPFLKLGLLGRPSWREEIILTPVATRPRAASCCRA